MCTQAVTFYKAVKCSCLWRWPRSRRTGRNLLLRWDDVLDHLPTPRAPHYTQTTPSLSLYTTTHTHTHTHTRTICTLSCLKCEIWPREARAIRLPRWSRCLLENIPIRWAGYKGKTPPANKWNTLSRITHAYTVSVYPEHINPASRASPPARRGRSTRGNVRQKIPLLPSIFLSPSAPRNSPCQTVHLHWP